MIELNAFLLWLICVGISAIAIGYFIKYYNNSPNEGFIVYSCPSNTTKYINNNGETNCCNGQIVDGRCTGNNVCSLSPTNTLKLPSCGDYTISLLRNAEKEYCFPEMPHYFASANGSLRGCSASVILPDGTAPADPGKLQCTLYSTAALDKIKLDSCYNYNLNKNKSTMANCPVAPMASIASMLPMTAAIVNPTGYVMSGDGITGQIPVQYILNASDSKMMVYFAQNGSNYIVNIVNPSAFESKTNGSYYAGDLNKGLIDLSKEGGKGKYTVSKIGEPSSKSKLPNTGYSMSGDTISGKIPVLFIVNYGPGNTWYFAQNGSKIIAATGDITKTTIFNGASFTADITQPIITYNSSVQATGQELKSITISNTSSGAPTSSANSTGYVMSGDGITGQIPVQKIISIPGRNPPNDDGKGYIAQNGQRFIFKGVQFGGSDQGESYSMSGTLTNTITNWESYMAFFNTQDRSTIKVGKFSVTKI
jgi:hypothetical protein